MASILITGGTGLIGKALTKALLQQGYSVIILTRDIAGKKPAPGIRYAVWDVKKQQIDLAAVQEADHIIHLAGAGVVDKKWTDAYKKEIRESRTESSRLLIDALKNNSNRVKTIVSMSAIGWYGPDTEPVKPFEETDGPANGFLGETCKRWEASIEPVVTLGKRLVKLRTGIVLAENGGALAEFKRPLHFGMAAILNNGKQMVSWIHIDDLCRMFIYVIENEELQGSYNAVAPAPVSNKTLTLTLATTMRGSFYIPIHVPGFVLKIMLGQRSIEVLKSATVSCKKILSAGFGFKYDTIDKALKDLIEK